MVSELEIMKYVKIALLLLWMITIFIFSNDTGSVSTEKSDNAIGTMANIISTIFQHHLSDEEIDTIINQSYVIVRKTAHVFEYVILSLLIIWMLKDYSFFYQHLFWWTLLFSLIYAISDEIHQCFIPERSGNVIDVFIDLLGVLIGMVIFRIIKLFFKPKIKC